MPVDTNIILQQAIAAHQLSDLNLAKSLYLSILKTNAQRADANHNLNLLYISVEQPADAFGNLGSWDQSKSTVSGAAKSCSRRLYCERFKKTI